MNKKSITIYGALIAFVLAVLVIGNTGKSAENVDEDIFSKAEFEVEGMTCAGCAFTVKESLENQEGVISAKVNIVSGIATIKYDGGKTNPENVARGLNEKTHYEATVVRGAEETSGS